MPYQGICTSRTGSCIDFTSIESTMELNQPPSIKNVLVVTDNSMRYSMAFVTKDQKAKTVACRYLYEWFISIFGACPLNY